ACMISQRRGNTARCCAPAVSVSGSLRFKLPLGPACGLTGGRSGLLGGDPADRRTKGNLFGGSIACRGGGARVVPSARRKPARLQIKTRNPRSCSVYTASAFFRRGPHGIEVILTQWLAISPEPARRTGIDFAKAGP